MRTRSSVLIAAFMGLTLVACGGDTPTGSIQFGWKLGFGVACTAPAAAIDSIRAHIFNPTTKKDVATAMTFDCGLGTASFPGVPTGTYNIVLEGGVGRTFTTPVFSGSATGIVVAAGKPTAVGEIRLAKAAPAINPGTLQANWRFQNGKFCAPNGVAQVRLTAWREDVYLDHDKTYDCDLGATQIVLAPSTYGFVAEGFDAKGRVVTQTQQDGVIVTANGVSTEFVLPDPVVLP